MASKLVILSSDELTATVEDATISDIVTTIIDPSKNVTGMYSVIQSLALFGGGMVLQNYRLGRGLNPFA
jgi:serine/threonine protein phosphatase PrpC